jgi:outer membrane protein, multidrug efflux system
VTQPIFTGGSISGQVKTAEAAQQEALFTYEKAIQTAFQDVDDSLVTMQKTREARDVQGRQVDALATYAHLARLRYEGGYSSYLEVLDAERSLFQSQLSYTQTQGAALASVVSLYKAMGGGWIGDAEQRTSVTYGENGAPAADTARNAPSP